MASDAAEITSDGSLLVFIWFLNQVISHNVVAHSGIKRVLMSACSTSLWERDNLFESTIVKGVFIVFIATN